MPIPLLWSLRRAAAPSATGFLFGRARFWLRPAIRGHVVVVCVTDRKEGGEPALLVDRRAQQEMGLVANLANSTFNVVSNSASPPEAEPIGDGEFSCTMQMFAGNFAFDFKRGQGLAPPASPPTAAWDIGIVQNVLYEKMLFKYEHRTVKTEFAKPAVDSQSSTSFPFIQDGVRVETADGFREVRPVQELYYNTNGLGELISPYDSFPNDLVPIPEKRRSVVQTVNFVDQPSFGCPLRPSNGGLLLEAYQIVTFMVWLVAIDPFRRAGSPQTLAHVGPFSLVYRAVALDPQNYTYTLSYPPYSYFAYGVNGYTRSVNAALQSRSPQIKVKSGKGERAPLLTGHTANQRDATWFVGTF